MKNLPGYVCDPPEIELDVFMAKPHYIGVTFKSCGKVVFTDSIKTAWSKARSRDDIHLCVATACKAITNQYGFEGDKFYDIVPDEVFLLVKNIVENLRTVRSKTGLLVWQRK